MIIIIFETYLFFLIFKIENLKVCVCTIGKEENLYAREYVSHYKRYNVDRIIIYDNNDLNGEKFEEVLSDYISSGFVKIIDNRGKISQQLQVYQDCLDNNSNQQCH